MRTNLILLDAMCGDYSTVRERAAALLDTPLGRAKPTLASMAQALLAECAAAEGRWEDLDAALDAAVEVVATHSCADVDLALCAVRLAGHARAAGELERAAMGWRLARQQHQALGRIADMERATAELAEIRSSLGP